MSKSKQAEEPNDPKEPMSPDLQNKTEREPTSLMTPFGLPNSSREEQLVPPPTKHVKKKHSMKEVNYFVLVLNFELLFLFWVNWRLKDVFDLLCFFANWGINFFHNYPGTSRAAG